MGVHWKKGTWTVFTFKRAWRIGEKGVVVFLIRWLIPQCTKTRNLYTTKILQSSGKLFVIWYKSNNIFLNQNIKNTSSNEIKNIITQTFY